MNTPEYDFLQALSDAQKAPGCAVPRLVAKSRAAEPVSFRLKVMGRRTLISGEPLAAYLKLGAETMEELRPVDRFGSMTAQMIIDIRWDLSQLSTGEADAFYRKHQQRRLEWFMNELAKQRKKTGKRAKPFDLATCEPYLWYQERAALAEKLIPARRELDRKCAVRADGALRLAEPLTPETIEALSQAFRMGLLPSMESELFPALLRKRS